MPVDKQSKASPSKPITPALSSRFRTTNVPLAPRLAGTSQSSPGSSIRKTLSHTTLSPQAEQNKAQSLSDNVTPRSGARNARISTESPTTPAAIRRLSGNGSMLSTISSAQKVSSISSTRAYPTTQNRLPFQSGSPGISTSRRTSISSTVSKNDEGSTKFFRANDTRPVPSYQSPKSTFSPRPLATPVITTGSPRPARSAPLPTTALQNDARGNHFVRAEDVKLRVRQSPVLGRKQSTSSVSSPRALSPDTSRSALVAKSQSQAFNQASAGKIMAAIADKVMSPRQEIVAPPSPIIPTSISPAEQRTSFGGNILNSLSERPILHRKSASVSSFDPSSRKFIHPAAVTLGQRFESAWISPVVPTPPHHNFIADSSPETMSPRSASLTSSKTIGTSVTSDTDVSEVSKTGFSVKASTPVDKAASVGLPHHVQVTALAQTQIDAANARRERKVLDLEISNSSLLAINKTLEKELRKQSSELRRFRRLSRSGRLSLAPSNRSVSGQSAMSLDALQEQSEDEDSISDEDEEDSDLDDFEDKHDYDPENIEPRNLAIARRRARDERRLMLDLSKHHQLLMDSQKLSQSIRKCLNISESLMKEANKALEYRVGIGDVKLGGRVLSSDDVDASHDFVEPDMPRQGLLSPSIATAGLQEAALWMHSFQPPVLPLDSIQRDAPEPE